MVDRFADLSEFKKKLGGIKWVQLSQNIVICQCLADELLINNIDLLTTDIIIIFCSTLSNNF